MYLVGYEIGSHRFFVLGHGKQTCRTFTNRKDAEACRATFAAKPGVTDAFVMKVGAA